LSIETPAAAYVCFPAPTPRVYVASGSVRPLVDPGEVPPPNPAKPASPEAGFVVGQGSLR